MKAITGRKTHVIGLAMFISMFPEIPIFNIKDGDRLIYWAEDNDGGGGWSKLLPYERDLFDGDLFSIHSDCMDMELFTLVYVHCNLEL